MLKLIEVKPIDINGNSVSGVKIANPEFPQKPVAILLIAKKGLIACGNFDINAMEKREVTAARVLGLTKIEDALNAKIESCTIKAKKLGVTEGMNGKEALKKMS